MLQDIKTLFMLHFLIKNENKIIFNTMKLMNWTVDLIEECGNVLRIEDKNNYIEYICSKKETETEYTKSFVQYNKRKK